jgi:hypothetical protein
MMNDEEREVVGGMITGRGNRSNRRKHAAVTLYPPQIPHNLVRARTRAAAVGSQSTNRLSYGTAQKAM